MTRKSHEEKITDPYQALAAAVLKNAITVWKTGKIREKKKVEEWLQTEGSVKSCEFWCTAAGVEVDWLREQLKKYENLKLSGNKKGDLDASINITKRPYKRK